MDFKASPRRQGAHWGQGVADAQPKEGRRKAGAMRKDGKAG